MGSSEPCPLAPVLRQRFDGDLNYVVDAYRVGPSVALCNYVCPAVLGVSRFLPDGSCAVRARLLREVYFSTFPRDPWSVLSARLDALSDGRPETRRLIETVKDIVQRYVFLAAYVSVNRDSPDFPQLLAETMSTEDYWPGDTDPAVIDLFDDLRRTEEAALRQRVRQRAWK